MWSCFWRVSSRIPSFLVWGSTTLPLTYSLVAQEVKSLPAIQETWVWSALGREDPLKKGMATHSSLLAWRIPWTEEPGWLPSVGSQRVRYDWVTNIVHTTAFWGVEGSQITSKANWRTTFLQGSIQFLSVFWSLPSHPIFISSTSLLSALATLNTLSYSPDVPWLFYPLNLGTHI